MQNAKYKIPVMLFRRGENDYMISTGVYPLQRTNQVFITSFIDRCHIISYHITSQAEASTTPFKWTGSNDKNKVDIMGRKIRLFYNAHSSLNAARALSHSQSLQNKKRSSCSLSSQSVLAPMQYTIPIHQYSAQNLQRQMV